MEYRVIWTIDLDASSAKEAAQKALQIMRDPESIATYFEVFELAKQPVGRAIGVDLDDEEEDS